VTIEEIDKFLDRLMSEEPGEDYSARLGRKWWHLEHKAGEIYGCPTCQPAFQTLSSMKHDVVNIHLGKPVFNPVEFTKGVKMVNEAFEKFKTAREKKHSVTHSQPEQHHH
jgi:hypothetical protein